jgi:hypothetical protein
LRPFGQLLHLLAANEQLAFGGLDELQIAANSRSGLFENGVTARAPMVVNEIRDHQTHDRCCDNDRGLLLFKISPPCAVLAGQDY